MITAHEQRVLIRATGRKSVADALGWIAEGHRLRPGNDPHDVLKAVLSANAAGERGAGDAVVRLAHDVSASGLDSAAVLFKIDEAAPAARFKRGLNALASKTTDGTLATITPASVRAAYYDEPLVVETLCAIGGLTFNQLRKRIDAGPGKIDGRWEPRDLDAAFAEIDSIVCGTLKPSIPAAAPARPYELLTSLSGLSVSGWQAVEQLRSKGAPFEVLLGQRAVGGAWELHRKATQNELNRVTADAVADALDKAGFEYVRATSVGGDAKKADVAALADGINEVSLIVRDSAHKPRAGVMFGTANDGGSARRSVDSFLGIKQTPLPLCLVLMGAGYAERNETASLVERFEGRVFTERSISSLVTEIRAICGP